MKRLSYKEKFAILEHQEDSLLNLLFSLKNGVDDGSRPAFEQQYDAIISRMQSLLRRLELRGVCFDNKEDGKRRERKEKKFGARILRKLFFEIAFKVAFEPLKSFHIMAEDEQVRQQVDRLSSTLAQVTALSKRLFSQGQQVEANVNRLKVLTKKIVF